MKIISYGVRPVEREFFNKLNKHSYELTFVEELLTDQNVDLCNGYDLVMIRGNCKADKINLEKIRNFGIKYLLTRTTGFNHIDLDSAKELGFELCAHVPAYSPNAISELAVSLALGLCRKTFAMLDKTSKKDFMVYDDYFAKEISLSTVGIIGLGKIGIESVKSFKGLSAKVIGFDTYPSDEIKNFVECVSLEELLEKSDIISIHCPYIKEKNYHMVNKEFINKMKKGAILINTARGELIDNEALLYGIESGHLGGVGLDVLENETRYFYKNFEGETLPDPIIEKLHNHYPKVLIIPHLGSFTDKALINMIEISYQNLEEFLTKKTCKNNLI